MAEATDITFTEIITNEVANAVTTIIRQPISTTVKLLSKLSDKFMSVKIKKTDLDEAEKKLKGELIDKWEEKVFQILFDF